MNYDTDNTRKYTYLRNTNFSLHFSFIHRRTNTLLKSILKCVQNYRGVPRKPAVLPVSSVEQMDEFENADEDCYTDVVSEKNNKIESFFLSPPPFSHSLSLSLSVSL